MTHVNSNNFVPPALNQLTKLPLEEQSRIFSYLNQQAHYTALTAIYQKKFSQRLSVRNFYPQRKYLDLMRIIPDTYWRITEYLPQINAKLKGTSHTVCNQLSRSELEVFTANPLISWLIPQQTPLAERTDCRKILSSQTRLLNIANHLETRLFSHAGGLEFLCDIFNELKNIESGRFRRFPVDCHSSYIAHHKGYYNWSSLLFTRHLMKDTLLPKPSLDLNHLEQSKRNLMLFMHLEDGNIRQFDECLFISSLYQSTTSDKECDVLIRSLLGQAAKQNHEITFKKLLTLQKPGKNENNQLFLNNPNELLVGLIYANIQPKYIAELLNSPFDFNEDYIPDNGFNRYCNGTPGIHTALMKAADNKHLKILQTILDARPGPLIDRRILENIRQLFQPNFMDVNQHEQLSLLVSAIENRNENYPHITDRTEMIELFDREIEERYPPIQAPNPEPVLAPAARGEQLLDNNDIPQEAILNDALAQPPQLPVVLALAPEPLAAEPSEPAHTPSDFLDAPGCALM
jgi:hypothetical protein